MNNAPANIVIPMALRLVFSGPRSATAQGKQEARSVEDVRDASLRFLLSTCALVVIGKVTGLAAPLSYWRGGIVTEARKIRAARSR